MYICICDIFIYVCIPIYEYVCMICSCQHVFWRNTHTHKRSRKKRLTLFLFTCHRQMVQSGQSVGNVFSI